MNQGIYITANDNQLDNLIAFLNSLRLYDPAIPVCVVPYDSNFKECEKIIKSFNDVIVFDDVETINYILSSVEDAFGKNFFSRIGQFKKQVCWFGPFERFLYIDIDVVVFSKISEMLKNLDTYDFLNYDYQYLNKNKFLFTDDITADNTLSEENLNHVFNGGFWGTRKNLFTKESWRQSLNDAASKKRYFDFSTKVSDQPVINYMILKAAKNSVNLMLYPEKDAGNWAGSTHFIKENNTLIDPNVNKPLKFLHWAGIKIQPGCPYWDIWLHYRNLNPLVTSYKTEKSPLSLKQLFKNLFRK